MPGGTLEHNLIASNFTSLLKSAVRPLSTKYFVLNSDQKIYIETARTAVYPDALVICEKPIFWNDRRDLIVNPLVVVEILSRTTSRYDRGDKFLLYQQLPSFREYVLVEQDRPEIEIWFREEENLWRKTVYNGLEVRAYLRSLEIPVLLSEVYENVSWS